MLFLCVCYFVVVFVFTVGLRRAAENHMLEMKQKTF